MKDSSLPKIRKPHGTQNIVMQQHQKTRRTQPLHQIRARFHLKQTGDYIRIGRTVGNQNIR